MVESITNRFVVKYFKATIIYNSFNQVYTKFHLIQAVFKLHLKTYQHQEIWFKILKWISIRNSKVWKHIIPKLIDRLTSSLILGTKIISKIYVCNQNWVLLQQCTRNATNWRFEKWLVIILQINTSHARSSEQLIVLAQKT